MLCHCYFFPSFPYRKHFNIYHRISFLVLNSVRMRYLLWTALFMADTCIIVVDCNYRKGFSLLSITAANYGYLLINKHLVTRMIYSNLFIKSVWTNWIMSQRIIIDEYGQVFMKFRWVLSLFRNNGYFGFLLVRNNLFIFCGNEYFI